MKQGAIVAVCLLGATCLGRAQTPVEEFQDSLTKLAAHPADDCPPAEHERPINLEYVAIGQAADNVADLNQTAATPSSPLERAVSTLKQLENLSAGINIAWPEESRFQFEVVDLSPALVVTAAIGGEQGFFLVGQAHPGRWDVAGSGEREWYGPGPIWESAVPGRDSSNGCGGYSHGIGYYAYEWSPGSVGPQLIIEQTGALGLEPPEGFPWVGTLTTDGAEITLPYCVHSRIDTWAKPSLCLVDTYDLSGDDVEFRSRTYNRPDLVPIAKAIEYAEQRDYYALLGYCGSLRITSTQLRSDLEGSASRWATLRHISSGSNSGTGAGCLSILKPNRPASLSEVDIVLEAGFTGTFQ